MKKNVFHVKWIILYYVNFYFDSKEMKFRLEEDLLRKPKNYFQYVSLVSLWATINLLFQVVV